MDLLDWDGEEMYFDRPLSAQVEALLDAAATSYGGSHVEAEVNLLRAYFLEPGHLSVLVALYRFFYYRHRFDEALVVAQRAIGLAAGELGIAQDWRDLNSNDIDHAAGVSMALTRFLLLALKGSGYLKLRIGDAAAALERFEKVVEMDGSDRLGMAELVWLARSKVTEEQCDSVGGNVSFIGR